ARIKAKGILALLAQGINPNQAVKAEREDIKERELQASIKRKLEGATLEEVLESYLKARRLRDKTARDYERFLKRSCSDWLDLPMVEIDRDMIQSRHLQMSAEHPAQANYTMRILRALFKYAMV